MESINETLEKALYFLSVVQNACDKKRLHIEQNSYRCYNTYLEKWKTGLKRKEELEKEQKRKELEKKQEKREKQDREVELLSKELDELVVADKMLEKARAIRNKKKIPPKQTLGIEITSSSKSANGLEKLNMLTTPHKSESFKDLGKSHSSISHSKSAPTFMSSKSFKMPHSKPISSTSLKKEVVVPKSSLNCKKNVNVQSSVCAKHVFESSEVGVVSNKHYNKLKCISGIPNHDDTQTRKCNKAKNSNKILTSD